VLAVICTPSIVAPAKSRTEMPDPPHSCSVSGEGVIVLPVMTAWPRSTSTARQTLPVKLLFSMRTPAAGSASIGWPCGFTNTP